MATSPRRAHLNGRPMARDIHPLHAGPPTRQQRRDLERRAARDRERSQVRDGRLVLGRLSSGDPTDDWQPVRQLTEAAIMAASTSPTGSWSKAQLAEWGVPWPPPKGWKARLMGTGPQ